MTQARRNDFQVRDEATFPEREEGAFPQQAILGTAHLARLAFEQQDLEPTWDSLCNRVLLNAYDAAALLDMSIMLLIAGHREQSLQTQKAALQICKLYHLRRRNSHGMRVLVFMAPGDLMSNTPIDFLIEGTDINLMLYYVDRDTRRIEHVPAHDVAFLAISESPGNKPILENIGNLLRHWKKPILNNLPEQIMQLTRDGVAAKFNRIDSILAPKTARLSRQEVDALVQGTIQVSSPPENRGFPFIIRPIGTHAGEGMQKIDSLNDLSSFLYARSEQEFYLCPFIDYSNEDRLFRKYRIAFIQGKAFPSHMAISQHWMVHYLNANMAEHLSRRQEEESWFFNFDEFALKNERAFAVISELIPLDYFVIDCSVLADGRLLLFEADTGMIVHDMDSVEIYPYKKTAMHKLFSAFEKSLENAAFRKNSNQIPARFQSPTFLLT
jgi:hypothetical protein